MRKKSFIIIAVAALLLSCGKPHGQGRATADELYQQHDSVLATADNFSDTIEIKYARGLSVSYEADGIHVVITNPDPAARHSRPDTLVITEPARRFICTTALQLGNFEVLGLEDRIVGMNSLRHLFSPRMREQMKTGQTVKIGKEGVFDVETIIASHPDYIFVSASKHGGFDVLRDCGIPLVTHHGYKETDPLGQAEWIKLIGLLTGEPRRANAVFADIERKYTTLRDEVANLQGPTPDPQGRGEGRGEIRSRGWALTYLLWPPDVSCATAGISSEGAVTWLSSSAMPEPDTSWLTTKTQAERLWILRPHTPGVWMPTSGRPTALLRANSPWRHWPLRMHDTPQ